MIATYMGFTFDKDAYSGMRIDLDAVWSEKVAVRNLSGPSVRSTIRYPFSRQPCVYYRAGKPPPGEPHSPQHWIHWVHNVLLDADFDRLDPVACAEQPCSE